MRCLNITTYSLPRQFTHADETGRRHANCEYILTIHGYIDNIYIYITIIGVCTGGITCVSATKEGGRYDTVQHVMAVFPGMPADFVLYGPVRVRRDAAQSKGIPFTVGVYQRLRHDSMPDRHVRLIRSVSALTELCGNDGELLSYIQQYDASFFEENALVYFFHTLTSGSMRDRVDALVVDGSRLVMELTTLMPEEMTADMAGWGIVLEVKQADVEGVTAVGVRQEEQRLPDGVWLQGNSWETGVEKR